MQEFTATQLRRDSSPVYNAVQAYKMVSIKNQTRPEMILITRSYFDQMLKSDTTREALIESIKSGDDISAVMLRIAKEMGQ